ncbi:hypothetical protein NL676_004580 [Syzygium grande]|nr:hypothetical protein NL676_004580 [Syzygium grande]
MPHSEEPARGCPCPGAGIGLTRPGFYIYPNRNRLAPPFFNSPSREHLQRIANIPLRPRSDAALISSGV